jgi:hypothetical protein
MTNRRLGVALDEIEANSAHGVYAAAAIKLLLLTGARVNEVLQLVGTGLTGTVTASSSLTARPARNPSF